MNLYQYRAALDAVSQGMLRTTLVLVEQLFRPGGDVGEARQALAPVLLTEIRARRRESYRIAVDFIRSESARQGVTDPYIPSQPGYPDASMDTVLRENLRGPEAPQAVAARLVQHVEDSARRTVVRSVEDEVPDVDEIGSEDDVGDEFTDPEETPPPNPFTREKPKLARSWARVLTGAENCRFCVMLASRGPVYTSAEDAGRMNASDKWMDAKGYVNSYHDNCDCMVVPIYSYGADWQGKEQWKRLEKLWQDSTKGYSGRDAMNALGRELSRMEREGEELPVENLRAA